LKKVLATGNDAVLRAALDAGAGMFCGYPITPSTEILAGWAKAASKNKNLVFVQTEDEAAAGFGAIGGILAGKKAWVATAGMGNVIMQDPLSLAEAMRIPIVVYIAQRGGPSTGTVIFSQQEVVLTRHGGNGEGLRIVYSPGNIQELYDYVFKAFNIAWKYYFPVFILSDGYLGKTLSEVTYHQGKSMPPHPIMLNEHRLAAGQHLNLRNCYSLEEELGEVLKKQIADWEKMSEKVTEHEEFYVKDADLLIFAHGSVSQAAKAAIMEARAKGLKVGLFRPLTLSPFPIKESRKIVKNIKKILTIEASLGQFSDIVKSAIFGATGALYFEFFKPAEGITPEEILEKIEEYL